MTANGAIAAGFELIRVLDRLGVDYLISGSLASSLHGIPRSTQDVDLVADLRLEHVAALVEALEADFHVGADAVREAVERRSSFSVVCLKTIFRVDVFVLGDDPLAREEMERRQRVVIDEESGAVVHFATAEDTILRKLTWHQLEGGADRHWQEAVGVLKVQGPSLDWEYLERWSRRLGTDELLARACRDAGLNPPTPADS